jgi:hypothetical protein
VPNDLNRFSLMPIVTRHFSAMKPPGRKRMSLSTIFVLFAGPATIGLFAAISGVFSVDHLTPGIAGLGVLAGAFLTGFVLLTNLRIKVRDEQSYRITLSRLIGQTAATAMYLLICCVAIIFVLLVGLVLKDLTKGVPYLLSSIVGIALGGMAHVCVTGMTFIRRLFGVYYQLFPGDFAPELTSVSGDVVPEDKSSIDIRERRHGS